MLHVGGFEVIRVPDIERLVLPTSRGFPRLTRPMLEEYLRRLGPGLVSPGDLGLVLSFHSWVLRRGDRVFLIDACVGNDKERPDRPKWHRRSSDYLAKLAAAGVRPEQVEAVMCTHLHADHVGWNTRLVDGRWVPTFPRARYVIAEAEYGYWKAEHARLGATAAHGSFADSVLPVVQSGQADMVPGNHRVAPGLQLEAAPGHTPGTVLIHVEDRGEHAVCTGDILHHPFQLECPDMPSDYCEDPEASARTRVGICARFADSPTRILTSHFPDPSSGFIRREGSAYRFEFDR